jgi:hypothetical protein
MLSFCLQGCFFYFPSLSRNVEIHGDYASRVEIDKFLEIGKTSKQEVQEAWDYPNIKMHDRNIWIYRGWKSKGYWIVGYSPFDPLDWRGVESPEKPLALFVKFDDNDRVKRYELTGVKSFVTDIDIDKVRQKALEWDN